MSLLNLFGIQEAFAQAPAAAGGQSGGYLSMIWMLVLFFVVFYFLLMRPQQKRAREHRKLMENLTKGDEVVTTAGLLGKIVKLTDDLVVLNVAENVDVTLQKNAIAGVLPKGTIKSL